MAEVSVSDNPQESRYELKLDGERLGQIDYRLREQRIALVHTEVDPSLQGQGLGGVLVRAVLDDVRARGLEVNPVCPFVSDYIRAHRDEYLDLVPESLHGHVIAGE